MVWTEFVLMYSWFCRFFRISVKKPCSLSPDTPSLQVSIGLWYMMDDTSVVLCDIKEVLGQQAYLLFYVR